MHSPESIADRALFPLLALCAAFSVLAIGSVHTPALLVSATLAAFAASAALVLHRSNSPSSPVLSLPIALLFALALITLLQAVPLPLSWLHRIAPLNADIWSRALLPLGLDPPARASISLDPGQSTVEALKLAAYAAVFYASSTLGARKGAASGLLIVFIASTLASLATLLHGLLGLDQVYGLYQPTFRPSPWQLGPLLNPNNLAGYLNLGIFSGLGLLLMHNPILPPWGAGLGIAFMLATTLATASRAGVLALIIGLILFSLLTRKARGSHRSLTSRRILLPASAALIAGLGFALLGTGRETWLELSDRDLQKIEHFGRVLPAVWDFGWLGMGRGAFESVYPAYKVTPGHYTYTHAENFILQWCADWGVPVACLALLGFAYTFSPNRLGATKGTVAAAAFVGLFTLLLQNLADLGLEIPALCIALCISMGALYGDTKRRRLHHGLSEPKPSFSQRLLKHRIAALIAPILGMTAFMAPVLAIGMRDLASDREELRTRMQQSGLNQAEQREAFVNTLRAAILRHPAEPYFPLVGALYSWREKTGDPLPWLQRALERMPLNGRAHLLLADVLIERKAKHQALMELRMAVESDASLVMPAAQSALRYSLHIEDLLRAVPQGKAGAAVLDAMGEQLNAKGGLAKDKHLAWESRRRCDEEALVRDPLRLGPRLRQVQMLFEALEGRGVEGGEGAKLCADRTGCERSLEEHERVLEQQAPESSHALRIRARRLTLQGKADEAERLLAGECSRYNDRKECIQQRVMSAASLAGPERLNAAIRDYMSASCIKAASCAEAGEWAGRLRLDRGEYLAAMPLLERAVREEGTEARWLLLAEIASKAGAHAKAADALQKVLEKRGGADPVLKKRMEEERGKAAGMLVGP